MLPHKLGRKDLENRLRCWITVAAKQEDSWELSEQLSRQLCSLVAVGSDTATMSFNADWPPRTASPASKIIIIGLNITKKV
jgi:hypothetical protein